MTKPTRITHKTTKAPAAPEPAGFAAWWATWYHGQAAGRRAHYAEAFAAGLAARADWIEPKPVVPPSRAQGSLDAWPFQQEHGRDC